MFKQPFNFLLSSIFLLNTWVFFPAAANAEIVTYGFAGSMVENLGASPFTDGEAFSGSISIDLNSPKSVDDGDAASYDNAIVAFDIEFGGGLRFEGVLGGSILINTNFGGAHLVRLIPVLQETQFSNSAQFLDSLDLSFIDTTSSSLLSPELTDLPQDMDGFTAFRRLQTEYFPSQEDLQYRSNGVIDTFELTAVPEPSGVLIISLVAACVGTRRTWRRLSALA